MKVTEGATFNCDVLVCCFEYVLRHFRRSCLKANKLSRSEETRKVEYVYIFESMLMPFTQNY